MPKNKSKRHDARRDARRTSRRGVDAATRSQNRLLLWIGGGAVALILVIVVAILASSGGGDGDFEMVTYTGHDVLGGEESRLSHLLGRGRPVVLNFWGGTCPPCRQEMPGFQRVYDQLKDDIFLVGVDSGRFFGLGTRNDALAFIDEFDITYPTAQAKNRAPLNRYGINALPATIILDPSGAVLDRRSGFIAEDQLQFTLDQAIRTVSRQAQSS